MKRFLLLTLLCLYSTLVIAQSTWTGNGTDTNWNTLANWNTTVMPDADDDVIIPTGFTVTLNVVTSVKSIDIQGNSVFNMNTHLTFTEPSTFGANTIINWSAGAINGTTSTLTNLGTINTIGSSFHHINGTTTLDNQGVLNITSSGGLYINYESVLNNPINGIIDLQGDLGNITSNQGTPGVINNVGLIKKTTIDTESRIYLILNNNDGTIQVESGTLSVFGLSKNFIDGTYNVFAGATMDWDTTINPSGTLEGTIVGDLNWNSIVNVEDGTYAAFNFSETDNFNWTSGTLSGGGTLTNINVLKLTTSSFHHVNGATTLDNQGILNIASSGGLYLNYESILNNPINGIIDMQGDLGNITTNQGTPGVINNVGLIKKTTIDTESRIYSPLNNNNGIIQVELGTLSIQGPDKNFTDGMYNVFTGATMDWDTTINPSGTLEGTVVGDLNWNNIVNVEVGTYAAFNFSETDNFNWTSGTLSGGGTLTNINVLKLTTSSFHHVNGATTLDNQGILNITSSGGLFLNYESVLNNPINGIIDMQGDLGNITFNQGTAGVVNNFGLIKKTTIDTESRIYIPLNNNNGTIQVELGTLSFQGTGINFIDGTYNVFAGATMDWDTTINPSGTLEGSVVGDLNWNNIINVVDGTFAAFNFSETDNFNWTAGTLNGGGTLTNINVLTLTGSGNHTISGATTLDNQGILNITSSGDLLLNNSSILNNSIDGIIDIQGDYANILWNINSAGVLNNAGLLKKTAINTLSLISVELNNSGIIQVELGELGITDGQPFTNEVTGIVKGIGIFDLPSAANYTNNGTFAPGLSPGTLNIQGDYKSSSTSVLDVELDGLVAGTEYDVLAITGTNVEFDGIVNVTLGFEPSVNDEFIIATTTGTISMCNIANTVSADFNGNTYTFDVFCRNDNELVIGVDSITLSLDENELNNSVSLYPNPVKNEFVIKNNGNIQLSNVLILDVNGRLIEKINLEEMTTEKQISISNYEAGLYLVQINSERGSVVKRIIKQ